MLSIVMCARNMERTLPKVLSKLVLREPEAEIVIVDDGSTDRTASIAKGFADDHPNIRLVSTGKNVGLLKARQIGYNQTKGEFIAFMDADDFITKGYYTRLAQICPDGGFSMGKAAKFGIMVYRPPIYGKDPYDWYLNGGELRDRSQMTYIWNKVFSRSLTDKMFKGWTVPYMVHLEDTVFMSRAFTFCTKVVYGDEGAYLQPMPSLTDVPKNREDRLPCYKVAYDLMCRYMVKEDVVKALQVRWIWDGFEGEFSPGSISK